MPPGTADAIISAGLLGATGVMDVDGLTIEVRVVDSIPQAASGKTPLVKSNVG